MLTSKTFREKYISYISKEKDFLNKTKHKSIEKTIIWHKKLKLKNSSWQKTLWTKYKDKP